MPVRTLRRRVGAVLVASSLVLPLLALTSASPASAEEPKLVVTGGGWGHGVGMGQYGAEGMGRQGKTATQILQHYYQGASVGTAGPWNDVRVLLAQPTASVQITPRANTRLLLPNGSTRALAANDDVLIGHPGNGHQYVKVNGVEVPGSPFTGSKVETLVELKGIRAVVAGVGEYRWGNLSVAMGSWLIPGTANKACPVQCVVARNMTMDQYLYGLAEVPSSWSSPALQAQAIAGRSYAAIRTQSPRVPGLYQLVATVYDQAYTGWSKEGGASGDRWVAAVNATTHKVLTYAGKVVQAFYSSSTGGHTENSEYVFGGPQASYPYLVGVPDPADSVSINPNHSWTRTYTLRQIGACFGVSDVRDVRITGELGVSGRIDNATVQVIGSTTKSFKGSSSSSTNPGFRQRIAKCFPSNQLLSTKVRLAVTSFPDVPPNSWYAPAVNWLVDEGITTGVGDTGLFKPNDPVTRAQMVTFLWRMMGEPTGYPSHGFPDVPSGSWYDAAVRWAKAKGITTGVGSSGRFEPNLVVNRAQMAVFLHRTAGLKGATTSHPFPDVPRTSWYDAAVDWAAQYDITTGVGDTGLYKPLDPVIRAQMAVFLHRTAGTASAWATTPPPTAP